MEAFLDEFSKALKQNSRTNFLEIYEGTPEEMFEIIAEQNFRQIPKLQNFRQKSLNTYINIWRNVTRNFHRNIYKSFSRDVLLFSLRNTYQNSCLVIFWSRFSGMRSLKSYVLRHLDATSRGVVVSSYYILFIH